jgi:PAS domain-containing protein
MAADRTSAPDDAVLARQARRVELASDAIFVRDLSGTTSYWDAAAEALYGWPGGLIPLRRGRPADPGTPPVS